MDTNITLPSVYYSPGENLIWWLISVPPYYCQNPYPTGDDFSTDNTFLGISMWDGNITSQRYSSGIKWGYTIGEEPSVSPYTGGSIINYVQAPNGTQQNLVNINRPGGAYNINSDSWGLQTSYRPGKASNSYFGPYNLNKTTDSTPYPAADGDIVIITTGSDVLYGAIEGGGAFGSGDFRIFNLLFYSTGSSNVQDLVAGVFGNNAAAAFPSYAESDRYAYFTHNDVAGSMSFVAVPDQGNPSNLIWWPITWQDVDPQLIMTRNDS